MPTIYLKKAAKTPETETEAAREVVAEMLAVIETGGEQAVRDYAIKLDGWRGDIVLDEAAIDQRTRDIPQPVKDDIAFAANQVRRFAEAQRASVQILRWRFLLASSLARSWFRSIRPDVTCRPAATPTSPRPTCRSRQRVRPELRQWLPARRRIRAKAFIRTCCMP